MYVRSITLANTGPISELSITLPFSDEVPKPFVLVGPNGSGKSTVLSFIVNALVGMKQRVFDNPEVEKGRSYRLRSPLSIHESANFSYAHIEFEDDAHLHEWQLDRTRSAFEEELKWTPNNQTWQQIPQTEGSHFNLLLGRLSSPPLLEEKLQKNCILFFPADRFESPDWLNSENLSPEFKLPEPSRMHGETDRRIFSRSRFRSTVRWMISTLFDMLIYDQRAIEIPLPSTGIVSPDNLSPIFRVPGPATLRFDAFVSILREILLDNPSDELQLGLGNRRARVININILRGGKVIRNIKDISSLSAGQAALFCLFGAIILDADLADINFKSTFDIRGIVLIDEADLHLHLSLQHKSLPRLLALFPKIQFILSLHSPFAVLGMESQFGHDGFSVIELPNATPINPEDYSEFSRAFDTFAATRKFENQLLARVKSQLKPIVLVEGLSDFILISTAWKKLYPNDELPYDIIPCGVDANIEARSGGAEMLRRCLEFLAIASDRTILAIFDNDRIGNEQFTGLSKKAFLAGSDSFHKQHKEKNIHAFLLPVPTGREIFVTPDSIVQRYLSIEHYFTDEILDKGNMKGACILKTSVFEITGDKVSFARKSSQFPPDEFASFTSIFARFNQLE